MLYVFDSKGNLYSQRGGHVHYAGNGIYVDDQALVSFESSGVVFRDNFDRIYRVGDLYIYYNNLGNLYRIGDTYIYYDNFGRINRVGDLYIYYNNLQRLHRIGDDYF